MTLDALPAGGRRIAPDTRIARLRLRGVDGESITLPDPERIVHLQLRRFAGCPICNLHLRSFATRHEEVAAAGAREVVVFHSTAEELRRYAPDLPFALVADPERRLYRYFGVESSPRALLWPRAWSAMIRGVAVSFGAALGHRGPSPPLRPKGGRLGLPGDFLIAPDGTLRACRYGTHAYDQWSVDELLGLILDDG